ncbi:MAG: polysaccharide deacetylase family protein [Rhodoferax sp.]
MGRVFRGLLLLCWCIGSAWAQQRAPAPLLPIYLYNSPHTAEYLRAQETSYDNTLGRWRKYLKRFGKHQREIGRAELLAGPEPGVLILASAQVLDAEERRAIDAFAARGGSLWATGQLATRDALGQDSGHAYLEQRLRLKVLPPRRRVDTDWFIMPFGDGPLTWPVPAGRRMSVGPTGPDVLLRVQSEHLAAVYMDWMRTKDDAVFNGAIAYDERDGSRSVYFAFAESVWNYHRQSDWMALLDAAMAWLRREPRLYKAAWPDAKVAAHLMEMDTEDKFFSAPRFAQHLEQIGVKGTFYCLTSVAVQYPHIVQDLMRRGHEIAYHADVHFGFKGLDPQEQEMRILNMKAQMKTLLGADLDQATGFRAPTEMYDATTEVLLRKHGMRHHAADPSATQDRLPFFSSAEPGLGPDKALVVLPRTQFDDVNFMRLLYGPARVDENLAYDLDLAVLSGAFSLLSVHTQNYVEGGLMDLTMGRYVQRVASYKDRLWVARGDEIAAWWRRRETLPAQVRKDSDGSWRVELAPGVPTTSWAGLTFMVTNPERGLLPTVSVEAGQGLRYRVQPVDAFRTAIVLEQDASFGVLRVRY